MIPLATFVGCAGWEERFRLGLAKTLETYVPSRMFIVTHEEYIEWSRVNIEYVERVAHERSIDLNVVRLRMDNPKQAWEVLEQELLTGIKKNSDVMVDISTLSRELTWSMLWLFDRQECNIRYTYNQPVSYAKQWISRGPMQPRLVYRMSGLSHFGRKTALLVLAGYDAERVELMLNVFEPATTHIGIHSGDTLDDPRLAKYKELCHGDRQAEVFRYDAISIENTEETLRKHLDMLCPDHNVLVCSLGPKLSAIPVFQLWRDRADIGLAYIPSSEFNRKYSSGFREQINGVV